ncbi:MAG: lysylphosphatidylglycerol synthase domain-containing protein [Actinomycetes bacterium]
MSSGAAMGTGLRRVLAARWPRPLVGLVVLVVAVVYLARTVRGDDLSRVVSAVLGDPAGIAAALITYAAAFGLRAWSWRRVLPAIPLGQAWAALHVSLLGNHVLPARLGEALRPASVVRRTDLPLGPVVASTVSLRGADLLAVLALAAVLAPAVVLSAAGPFGLALAATAVMALTAGGLVWSRRHRGHVLLPGPAVAAAAIVAWALEAVVVWQVCRAAGAPVSAYEAVGVTAVTIAAQVLALTPGGFGTYEAAATAALVGVGVGPGTAFAIALTTHALKTAYALAVGSLALVVPAPSFWGRLRLPRREPDRPPAVPVRADAPVAVMIPVRDEERTIADVVSRVPGRCAGRPVRVLVIDDGSTDGSAAAAADAGATVVAHPGNLGLGAAVRRGLAEASALAPAAVVYLDGDGEYFPEDIERVAGPVLAGDVDYCVGSRFAGDIRRMLPHRRAGNVALTRWLRWVSRRRDITDGQSGARAFSAAAAADAEVVHDYNYAQVLTLDLLAKGYRYGEVPITYAFREWGTSFVRPGRYLRRVVPAVHRELNTAPLAQSSTTWVANRLRAAAHDEPSSPPSSRSAVTAS